jgi:dehydrogenases with different specificities (related to short-chain alcohol dehydrogenases)
MKSKGNVLITGTSSGIGLACAIKFIDEGFTVYGIDKLEDNIKHENYHHIQKDMRSKSLPDLPEIEYVINNAGQQTDNFSINEDIDVNLVGLMNVTEKYVIDNKNIKGVLNQASVSAHNGAEFPSYTASKGGVLAYTKWLGKHLANNKYKHKPTVMSLSLGGVLTDLNLSLIEDEYKWNKVMKETPLKKWMTIHEAAEWVYFLTVINKSCTCQDIIVDNGEMMNHTFVW